MTRSDVVFTQFDVVEPDLLFIAADQSKILTEKHVRGAPAIVIEIVSRGTQKTDRTVKHALFDRHRVREYWMVDPERDVVSVHRRAAGGSFSSVEELASTATLTTPLLPGLSVSLPALFQRQTAEP